MDADAREAMALLTRSRRNDAAAVKQLYLRCSLVVPYVQRLCGDAALARDVHHDTVTEIWQGTATFRGESRFSTWVIGIARHLALDALRRRRRSPAEGLALDAMDPDAAEQALREAHASAPSPQDPMHALVESRQREGILDCIGKLSPKLGECLLLAYYADMSAAEIATLLGLNSNTVKTRIRDAHLRIADCLGRVVAEGRK